MKSVAAICLFGVVALAGTAWAQAQQGDDTSEKAAAALENQWLESQKTNNPDLVAPLLADKFVSTSAEGKLQSKAEMLAATRKRKYTSVEYNDVHVTAFGNTAIAVTCTSLYSTLVYLRFRVAAS